MRSRWAGTSWAVAAIVGVWVGFAEPARAVPVGYALAWADEFDGDVLDASKWGPHQPGPRRSAINVDDAVYLDGAGNLAIDTWTEDGVHYTGMVNTRNRFEPTYGWIEARISFQDMAPGMWSAFWMQSRDMGSIVGDPGASGVEIDIQEARAECAPGCDISDLWQGSMYWDGYGADLKRLSKGRLVPGLGDGDFHVFALEWTPNAYRFYVDGELVWEPVDPPISHHGEFIILSSEVESVASFSGFIPEGGFGARDESTTRMVVDYVRVYQVVPEPGTALLGALGLTFLATRRGARARPS